jgi:hypothetical protein
MDLIPGAHTIDAAVDAAFESGPPPDGIPVLEVFATDADCSKFRAKLRKKCGDDTIRLDTISSWYYIVILARHPADVRESFVRALLSAQGKASPQELLDMGKRYMSE